jgi:MraZ protein
VSSVLLVGTHDRRVDEKGRLALPALYREYFQERCYVTRGRKKCLDVIATEQFERVAADMLEGVKRGEVTETQLMAVAASAVLTTIDKQGRVLIDEKLRQYAGLSTDQSVVVSGRLDRLQIWAPERFAVIDATSADDLSDDAPAELATAGG